MLSQVWLQAKHMVGVTEIPELQRVREMEFKFEVRMGNTAGR